MLFTETRPLALPLTIASDRLHSHPNLDRALSVASVAAFDDGLGSLSNAIDPSMPPLTVRVQALVPYRRAETSVLAFRWFTTVAGEESSELILDANIELQPDRSVGARLALFGSYWPAAGLRAHVHAGAQNEAFQASARSLLRRTAEILASPGTA